MPTYMKSRVYRKKLAKKLQKILIKYAQVTRHKLSPHRHVLRCGLGDHDELSQLEALEGDFRWENKP